MGLLWGKEKNLLTSCRGDEVCRGQDVKCNTGYRHLERGAKVIEVYLEEICKDTTSEREEVIKKTVEK